MSCDEVAMIHENTGRGLNKYLFKTRKINSSSVIFLSPVVFLVVIIFAVKLKKYLRGSAKARKMLLAGAAVFILGAFILEAGTNYFNKQESKWLWTTEIILEEGFEILGVIFIIFGLTEHRKFLLEN